MTSYFCNGCSDLDGAGKRLFPAFPAFNNKSMEGIEKQERQGKARKAGKCRDGRKKQGGRKKHGRKGCSPPSLLFPVFPAFG